MDEIKQTFYDLFVLAKDNDIISLGSITSYVFVVASLLLTFKYLKTRQYKSEMITAGIVTLTYLTTGVTVEFVRPLLVELGVSLGANGFNDASVIYLIFAALPIPSLISIWLLHKSTKTDISPLFIATTGVFIALSLFNSYYWFRYNILDITITDGLFNYSYWFFANYLSFALAVACFYPKVLSNRVQRAFINPLSLVFR